MKRVIDISEDAYELLLEKGTCGKFANLGEIVANSTPLKQELTSKNDLGVDCISRADAIRVASGYCHPSNVAKELAKLPSVTLQEPKTGHWIETHDDWGNGIITDRKYKCSVCHGKHIDPEMGEWHEVFDYKYPFCPNCGVKMAESEENEE